MSEQEKKWTLDALAALSNAIADSKHIMKSSPIAGLDVLERLISNGFTITRQPENTKVSPDDAYNLALKFHDTYERLAPLFGYETRQETKLFNKDSSNGRLMIAVCQEIYQSFTRQPAMTDEELEREADAVARLHYTQRKDAIMALAKKYRG